MRPRDLDTCSACLGRGHKARHGECSAAYRAARMVGRGMSVVDAAREVGITPQRVTERLRSESRPENRP